MFEPKSLFISMMVLVSPSTAVKQSSVPSHRRAFIQPTQQIRSTESNKDNIILLPGVAFRQMSIHSQPSTFIQPTHQAHSTDVYKLDVTNIKESLPARSEKIIRNSFIVISAVASKALAQCYQKTFLSGDLTRTFDWSISRVLAYDYNVINRYAIILPTFLAMIGLYAHRHQNKPHVQVGAKNAAVAAVGIFRFDVLEHPFAHLVSVALMGKAAWHWKRDLSIAQAKTSTVGLVTALLGWLSPFFFSKHSIFGAMHGMGEIILVLTWASMFFNE